MSTHSPQMVADKGIGAEEVLILQPTREGTTVSVGKDNVQIRALLEAGASIAEAVMPLTEPREAHQLELFVGS